MASFATLLLWLLVVAAAIPATLWLVKRAQALRAGGLGRGGSGARAMGVIAQLSLGPRERLVTVRVGERILVVGVTEQQVNLVAELPEGLPEPSPVTRARRLA